MNPNGQARPRNTGGEAIQGSLERICRFPRLPGTSEQFCAEVYHSLAQLSQEKRISVDVNDILVHLIMHERD